ncbi:hypothetical protein HMPREF0044_1136 [Gleimia coleocanis DSM 15436]|uniref:Flavin reductase like domain-containing protein n=1 Tax=Gleimia coleocanis DSM 15436 TaxID=525245 RepID=C0W146_9ACTO|nr:flavin reductase family protein [Gleimia coleocanis]EEH63535.1 hypothetical protein HMPREF0044_1136 [Gleimia coleocanis DSM 15436]
MRKVHYVEELTPAETYDMAMSIVAPRLVAWVSTYNSDESVNIAPYAMSGVVSINPLIVEFCSIGKKDTYFNAMDRKAFGFNIPSQRHKELVITSAKPLKRNESEAEQCGIHTRKGEKVDAPVIELTQASFECEVIDTKEIGESTIVYGAVKAIHTAEGLVSPEGFADFAQLNPLTKLGGNQWGTTEAFV